MIGKIYRMPGSLATLTPRGGAAQPIKSVPAGDTMVYSTPPPDAPDPKFEVDTQQLVKSLRRMTVGALVGAASMGGSSLFCLAGMMVSETRGQENVPFVVGGLTLGVGAGAVASMCGASPIISLAVGGGISQAVMSLADWFGR